MSRKVWFITGASSGFGRSMTELVLEKGDIAVATLRKPEAISDLASQYTSERLLVLKLDVSKPQEITAAFDAAVKTFGRIDVVFNNAGYAILGEVEATTDQLARGIFDVNFFGALNVSKEAIRIFREVNQPQGGRLIQTSSAIVYYEPGASALYAATKRALNAVTEALVVELNPAWNIKVTAVEAGAFRTKGTENMVRTELHPAYVDFPPPANSFRNFMPDNSWPAGTPPVSAAVKAIYKLAHVEDPPLLLPLGKDAVLAAKKRSTELLANVEKVASWSEGMDA